MGASAERTDLPGLVQKARRIGDGRDWEDLSFRPSLELLVRSCETTGDLSPQGRRVLDSIVVRHLVNRLLIEAEEEARPAVWSRPVGPAVVVTGLPRTGTTLLHNLLALDPAWRVLRFWEALRPVPPDPAKGETEEAMVAQATRWLERLYDLVPDFRSIHPARAEGPEECDALLQNDFASQHFDDMFNAEDYSDWLATAPLRGEYRSYARQLNVLRRPEDCERPWLLKSPSHLGHLDALLAACPEVTVVHLHRPPGEAVPSYASLMLCLRRAYAASVSPAAVGAQALRRCRTALSRALEVRQAAPGHFVDVTYADLVQRPHATVAALYERLGRTPGAEQGASISAWLARHPQHAHGVHRYTAEEFGLRSSAMSDAFSAYLEQHR